MHSDDFKYRKCCTQDKQVLHFSMFIFLKGNNLMVINISVTSVPQLYVIRMIRLLLFCFWYLLFNTFTLDTLIFQIQDCRNFSLFSSITLCICITINNPFFSQMTPGPVTFLIKFEKHHHKPSAIVYWCMVLKFTLVK